MIMRGKAHKYGENIDTDAILPGRHLNIADPKELAQHCMEDFDPSFRSRVTPGDILVARKNYGCGSSREHAPVAIRANGIACIIADSFARIFYRNAMNLALPLIECAALAEITETGDDVEVDLRRGLAINHTKKKTFSFNSYPGFMMDIIDAGGLTAYTRDSI